MSRYTSNNGGSNDSNNNDDYDDQTTLKLQEYAALRVEPDNLNVSSHEQYGTSFITNFEDAEVLDGIVFQRDDKPDTWKVFSAGKFFNLNPEDGLVYESFDDDEGYSGEMSAQDVLDHPRVAGFSENFGGQDYFYTPIGVVIEEAADVAVNDDVEVSTTSEPAIEAGEAAMLLGNKTWVRTLAKKMAASGNEVINDNGDDPTPRGEPHTNPKYDDSEWLATEEVSLRSELEGRTLELWITEEEMEVENGTVSYRTPNLMDAKTSNFVTIDNGIQSGDDSEANSDKATATDGGTATESADSSDTESPQEPQTTQAPSADPEGALPEDVPEVLDDLIDYMARNGQTDADEIREFAADEVDDPDAIDWEAAAEEANRRAE